MKAIKAARGQEILIDDEDYIWLNQIKWYVYKINNYERIVSSHPTLYMNIEIMKRHDLYEEGKDIRNINGNRLDCQKHNLKMISRSHSLFYQKMNNNNKSGYKCITKYRNGYLVRIFIDDKEIRKYFKNLDVAIKYEENFRECMKELLEQ
jgi:hypothetical protein